VLQLGVCCSALQLGVCCSALQLGVCCSALQLGVSRIGMSALAKIDKNADKIEVRVLQCIAVHYSALQYATEWLVCSSVLQLRGPSCLCC